MTTWTIHISKEAQKDLEKLEGNVKNRCWQALLKFLKHLFRVPMAMENHWDIKKEIILPDFLKSNIKESVSELYTLWCRIK